jgi:hypothetical protein
MKEWKRDNPEKAKERKRQWYLKNRELCIQRAARSKPKKGTRVILTPEMREQRKVEIKQYMRTYYKNNKETIVNRWLVAKKRYMLDPMYRMKEAMRTRVNRVFKVKGYDKDSTTCGLLGCDYDVLVGHITAQFSEGMTWDNKGEWHIDHIIPLCAANTKEELENLCHYKNLQPLWAADNFSKNRKILDEYLSLKRELLG